MFQKLGLWLAFFAFAVGLSACSADSDTLGEQEALDLAWQALDPNSSSHNRANWAVVEARRVAGSQVAEEFSGEPAGPGCWMGPEPPANGEITASANYWYVQLRPHPATPDPQKSPPSATAPPAVPEPFLRQAFLLIDAYDGHVVARRLHCVIY